MSLVDALRYPEDPVRMFLYDQFPNTAPITRDARNWLKLTRTILPAQEIPWGTIGKALNIRIRYYYQTEPSILEWSGFRNLNDDLRNVRCLPKEFQFIPGLFQEFSTSLTETLKCLRPVGRRLEPPEEETLARYCILLAAFQQWSPYRPYGSLLMLPKRKQTFSGLLALVKPHWIDDLCKLSWLFYDRPYSPFAQSFSREAVFEAKFEGIGWANADLIVDSRLIEIKTTTRPKLERQWIYQLIAYVLLDHTDSYRLHTAEIYMARQGWYCSWSLPGLLNTLHGDKIRSVHKLKMQFQKICQRTILGH